MTDARATRKHDDTAVLSINLSSGRTTQHLLAYRVDFDEAYAIGVEIDKVVRKILESKCKTLEK